MEIRKLEHYSWIPGGRITEMNASPVNNMCMHTIVGESLIGILLSTIDYNSITNTMDLMMKS